MIASFQTAQGCKTQRQLLRAGMKSARDDLVEFIIDDSFPIKRLNKCFLVQQLLYFVVFHKVFVLCLIRAVYVVGLEAVL